MRRNGPLVRVKSRPLCKQAGASANGHDSMDETKKQPTELPELPEGDLDLDLADLDLDVPDLAELDPKLPVVDDTGVSGSPDDLGDMGDMSDLVTDELAPPAMSGSDSGSLSMDWELPPDESEGLAASTEPGGPSGALDPLAPPEDEDDLQPVALSESELENILGSADDPLQSQVDDFDSSLEAPPMAGDFQELGSDEGDLELSDADLTVDADTGPAQAAEADVEYEELTPLAEGPDTDFDVPAEAVVAGFPEEEDDEPVTLSEDELGSILDDVDTEAVFAGGIEPDSDTALSPGLEEDITLSDEELNQVLLEGDVPLAAAGVALGAGAPSLLDEEDDEPITLTAEELGNIVADVEEEEAGIGPPLTSSILDSEDDEGPVALSENELEAILEDVDEGASVAGTPMDLGAEGFEEGPGATAEEHVIVLDEYEDEGLESPAAMAGAAAVAAAGATALRPSREESAVVDRAADRSGLDRGELKKMISYLDGLFDQLPDSTVEEFSRSEYYDLYKKIMSELGIG